MEYSRIIIQGGHELRGDITISGMKNAALPILFATILIRDTVVLENVPPVSDILNTLEILRTMGARVVERDRTTYEINTTDLRQGSAPRPIVNRLRGSYYLLGAELGRFHRAMTFQPGGCNLGDRPIDQHIAGFTKLGAHVDPHDGMIDATAPNGLTGNRIFPDIVSVGTTMNVMIAAVLAEGTTVIENAAREPHVVDLANFLNTCGANITGAGTTMIRIRGVRELHGCTYSIVPDMIEAGTYMVAAAAAGGCVRVRSIIPKHLEIIGSKLTEMGVAVSEEDDAVSVRSTGVLRSVNIRTTPYPGFPTDMQPQFVPLLCLADGISCIQENIWEKRFTYVNELLKMGANISLDGKCATIIGTRRLTGTGVTATDLRAGAALVIAGLCAEGETEISGVEHIERGYCDMVDRLRDLGAVVRTAP